MLDTNTVSYILKAKSPAAIHRLSGLKPNEEVCISAITEAELWYGLHRTAAGQARHSDLDEFILHVPVMPWRTEEAHTYGILRAAQEAAGRSLAPHDMLIAAHAITLGAVLASSDRDFRQVAGLPGLENWATDI
jgi:tRNA(fMet)-specific endonuclease VapC